MTRDEARADIQFHLGNRSDLADKIISEMKRAQRLLEKGHTLPWFLLSENASLALAAGSADKAFPSDFLREYEDEAFHFTDSDTQDEVYLEKVPLRVGETRFADEDAGQPIAYAIRATGWRFWPERDIAYTLSYGYFKTGGTLDTDTSTHLWLVHAPDLIIGMAGASVAETLGHDRAKAHFEAIGATAWKSVFGETVLRREENYPLMMGSRN